MTRRQLLVCALCLSAALAHAQIDGDANCDGHIDTADLDAVAFAIFEGGACPAADVNADGVVSAADLSAAVPFVVHALPTGSYRMTYAPPLNN